MSPLSDFLDRYLPLIESDLNTMLQPPAGSPLPLYHMLHYHMGWLDEAGQPAKSSGKRIRPVLALLTCEAVCGDCNAARPAAAAVELIHNFSLLHDDIQDSSSTRHNRPTVWKLWGKEQAINAGDLMFALAFLAIPHLSPPDLDQRIGGRMVEIVGEICRELTRGQYLDMAFEAREQVSIEEYLEMVCGKTAALLAGSARLGALAAGADDSTQDHYHAFGENLGMAFQVLDDVLDVWGDPATTGKEAASDVRQRKKSLPVLYGLSRSPALCDLYARPEPFDNATVARVVELLNGVEARQYAANLALMYSERALTYLEVAGPQGDAGEALFELADRLLHRVR